MTFSMTQTTKIVVEEDEDAPPKLTQRELEDLERAEKEAQQKRDDIATLIAMTIILVASVLVVIFKLTVIDEPPNPNISTFRPLDQQVGSSIMYNGNGYMPCNGNLPCQIWHLPPEVNAERLEGALPCHNYQGFGPSPKGCW